MGRINSFKLTHRLLVLFRQARRARGKLTSRLSVALVTGLFMAGCASTPLATVTETASVAASPTEPPSLDTPAASATALPTATATATDTTQAPTPSPTSALAVACNTAPATVSPDGKWVFCDAKDSNGISIPYAISAAGQRWNISFKQIAGPAPIYDDNKVLVWTPDDRYVYVLLHGQATSAGRFFYAGGDIYRMDLSSGALKDLVPIGEFEAHFYDLSVSPDGKRLAYVDQWQTPLMLDLLALPGDTRTEIKLADTKQGNDHPVTAGELVWTPDGKKLIYKQITDQPLNQCAYDYSILIMDLGSHSTQTIIGDQSIGLCNGEPAEYHVLQVDNQSIILEHNGALWRYDIASNKLEPQASPTATP